MNWEQVIFRLFLTVIIGAIIGTERASHGRAAGMRTHILVCMGSALTAMTGIFVNDTWGSGDVLRISAQVISGIGFLCAGLIIHKNGNFITGLTTAAGMWTTASIGIAIGYGFYEGAILVTLFLYFSLILFAKLERNKRNAETFYIEIDDLKSVNQVLSNLEEIITVDFSISIVEAKSCNHQNLGVYLTLRKKACIEINDILKINSIIYVIEE